MGRDVTLNYKSRGQNKILADNKRQSGGQKRGASPNN